MGKTESSMTEIQQQINLSIPGEAKIILNALSKIHSGSISITTPEGLKYNHTGKNEGPKVALIIKDYQALVEIFYKADIGLAEAFFENKFEVSSISDLIELAILNESTLKRAFIGDAAKILYYRLLHEKRENTKEGSRKNISAHYDLGNNFYQLWLDSSMTYSSALFKSENDSLLDAQINKYQSMLDMIDAKKDDHILEIGCGWGGFLEFAGKKGHRVTGITISKEQFDFATERIKKQNLEHLIEIKLCDYRDLEGHFDCAVSIEMIEAVGEQYWESYFSMFKKVLRPNAKFAIQAIIMNDKNFSSYKKGTDFIQQYIFPGGMLLSPNTIKKELKKQNHQFIKMHEFGLDYAKTLNIWSEKFNQQATEIMALNFDDKFMRLWNFYLGYCEGAFKSKRIDVVQFVAQVQK